MTTPPTMEPADHEFVAHYEEAVTGLLDHVADHLSRMSREEAVCRLAGQFANLGDDEGKTSALAATALVLLVEERAR